MKLKNWIELIGFKGKTNRFGYKIKEFSCDNHLIKYAQWQHPKEKSKVINSEDIVAYKKFLSEGDFCIDIGAHTGDSTLPIAAAVGKTGLVLAVEPNHYVFPILQKNCLMNKNKYNIIPIYGAAHKKNEELIFHYSDKNYCNGGNHNSVNIFKRGHNFKLSVWGLDLKDLLEQDFSEELKKLSYIKIDTEGNDLYVINSIFDILTNYRPFIKFEIFKFTTREYREKLMSVFNKIEYKLFYVEKDPVTVSFEINIENICKNKHYDVFALPVEKIEMTLDKLQIK